MRSIDSEDISRAVAALCIKANCFLSSDIRKAFDKALANEKKELPKEILGQLIENYRIAEKKKIPICQDTGMAVVFVELGRNILIEGASIEKAIQEGVRRGYEEGYLRKSVVGDPFNRVNTGDNTPAVTHYEMAEHENLVITVAPKGFGSENMSAVKMLKPADGEKKVKEFVVETVKKAGSNPCPPLIVGVGIGGTMEKAALLSKKALTRNMEDRNNNPYYANMETELLRRINDLGIGPSGLGGKTTALGVNIEIFPTHIAGLPVAVNIGCHVTRHETVVI